LVHAEQAYRGTSLIRNTPLLGPYSRTIPRVLWWCQGGEAVSYERGAPVPGWSGESVAHATHVASL